MKRLSIVLALLLMMGCTNVHHSESTRYVHVVFMWLKNPGNEADRQAIIDRARSFVGKIPGLVSVAAGPVKPSTRPVVDSTYDVGLMMIFEDEKSLDSYGPHPVHQQAVKEVITPLVDHYKVYDFADAPTLKGRSGERPFGALDSTLK